jgi:hypothetical protein
MTATAQRHAMSYLHGCNYPWSADGTTVYYGMDFGANIWGSHLGVSTRRPAVQRDFDQMASLGFVVARWFVFGDGRAGIIYDEQGLPIGLDGQFFADLDAALEIARSVDMSLVLVLLDHRWMFRNLPDVTADPAAGAIVETRLPYGRETVLGTEAGHDALLAHVLAPIVQRYAPQGVRADLSQQLLAYELMNEPDFIIEEWEADVSSDVPRPVRFEMFATLVSRFSALVHRHSSALTTIGCARLHNLWAWDDPGLGLDVLSLHSYPDLRRPEREVDLFGTPASALGVRRPIILGEFPGDGPNQHPSSVRPPETTLDEYLEFGVSSGYLGAWPWSFSGTDAYGRVPRPALRRFAARHPGLVNPRALTAPFQD